MGEGDREEPGGTPFGNFSPKGWEEGAKRSLCVPRVWVLEKKAPLCFGGFVFNNWCSHTGEGKQIFQTSVLATFHRFKKERLWVG